ncbi:hypothetical protein SAY87_022007 [Trapa incisa]|uniref:Synergin gamma C-terminal domain-containing protein n=1 Tax=Trapa incisa TaxID=236973 RepID=A0AAN7JU80_9MYRT|nr:hypothetical protein SAY87_022007 [Trapa incisa]
MAMVDILAEEEDDEGFGEFKFISTITTTTSPNPAAASNRISDDDWSDFVSFNVSPQIKSDPNPPASTNPPEPFDFFADLATSQRSADTSPIGTVPEKSKWAKLSGAIPLSIFGEEEAEEDGSGGDVSSFNDAADFSNRSNGDPVRKAPNLSSPVGLNDLIANLYNQNHQTSHPSDGTRVSLTSNGREPAKLDEGIGLKVELNPKQISNGFDSKTSNRNEAQDDEDELDLRVEDAEPNKGENAMGNQNKADDFGSALNNSFFPSWNDLSSDPNGFTSNSDGLKSSTNGFSFPGVEKLDGGDDDFNWEFKGAEMENNSKEGNSKVEGNSWELFQEVELKFEKGEQEATVFTGTSNKNPQIVGLDFKYDLSPVAGSLSGVLENSNTTSSMGDAKIGMNPAPGSVTFDEDEWEFMEATSQIGPDAHDEPMVVKNGTTMAYIGNDDAALQNGLPFKEDLKVVNGILLAPDVGNVGSTDDFWGIQDVFADSNVKEERNAKIQIDGKETFPLSTFGNEQVENHGSLDYPTLDPRKVLNETSSVRRQASDMSISDLISSLYDQEKSAASVPDVQVLCETELGSPKPTMKEESENEFDDSWDFQAAEMEKDINLTSHIPTQHLSGSVSDSRPSGQSSRMINNADIYDNSSWGFEDPSSQFGYGNQGFAPNLAEPREKFLAKMEIDELLDFYFKLKDELCLIALSHLYRIKEAQGSFGLPNNYAALEAQNKEIQELYNGLDPDNSIGEGHSVDLPTRVSQLKEFIPTLGENFQVLDAEYQLSKKLFLVEEDPEVLTELLRHVSSILRILKWGSVEDHSCYISIWSKLISVCHKELKHGSFMWKQAFEKDVQGQLLCKSEVNRYILALGEIYRVVGVLGASIKLHKPWILTSSVDVSATLVLLEECSVLWSSSGLDEALRSMPDPLEFPYEGNVADLLKSIKDAHCFNASAFQACNFANESQICRISLLSANHIPGMKMTEWNGDQYFLKLINLWANLVSCDPPELPKLEIS